MAKKKQTVHINSSGFIKPPVVAVMGHVDHGKTTLLDYIRKSRVALGEFGSITQHIGAYQVPVGDKKITFIDTPGHEAFTNLRSRGASVADIALLVIDAKESVKPQTVESIKIIQKANIPTIVVLTKMDISGANPDKVKKDLLQKNVIVEEHGGSIASVPVSAKTGEGVDDLLETILLVSELKNVTADPHAPLSAVVIEAKKDPGRGNVATIIVQQGTLRVRDEVRVEQETFLVRALIDEYGKGINEALPGRPVEILGFKSMPSVGSVISAKNATPVKVTPEESEKKDPSTEDAAILKLFLKADTFGSLEAIVHGLPREVSVSQTGIGEITESDIAQAKTMDLVVIGFNVKVPGRVAKLAKDEGVRIRAYTIIYKLFEEIEEVVTLL
ncbi:GTP-binding protein, partial [Candidatus Roizmanbacteria bacterium]|nr:GTP-binding protein [Candidatus Roizmanbacteria bacterium]